MSKLQGLSESAPMLCANKVYFLEAEIAALHGNIPNVMQNYVEAISLSKKHGLQNEEAMACKRIAMLFLNLNVQSFALKFS